MSDRRSGLPAARVAPVELLASGPRGGGSRPRALLWARQPPQAQRREGELQAFINPEAKDLDTKLEVLQQTLYEVTRS